MQNFEAYHNARGLLKAYTDRFGWNNSLDFYEIAHWMFEEHDGKDNAQKAINVNYHARVYRHYLIAREAFLEYVKEHDLKYYDDLKFIDWCYET